MTVEKACGYIREALEEMGENVGYDHDHGEWVLVNANVDLFMTRHPVNLLLFALDSLDPMGTTYKEEG